VDTWASYTPRTTSSGVPMRDGAVRIDGTLELRVEGDVLTVARADAAEAWTAGTELRAKPLFAVAEGQWGRVVWNAKDGDGEHKWLVEVVVNAGIFAGPPASQVFFGAAAFARDLRRDFLHNTYR
jgi:hypothetical protein